MAKMRIEVCLISARGLPRSSALWKRQWFAVGWIDPRSKFCSKIDSSGSANPTWNAKFSDSIDDGEVNPQDAVLTVQVHRRDPVFLRTKLYGTATVALKEFFGKYGDVPGGDRQVGSFQLRKKKSGRPQGFVDVAVRIAEAAEADSAAGRVEEVGRWERGRSGISLAIDDGQIFDDPSYLRRPSDGEHRDYPMAIPSYPYPPRNPHGGHQMPSYPHAQLMQPALAINTSSSSPAAPPRREGTPPPPPPPSNTGFIPPFFPGLGRPPESYVNLPNGTGRTAYGGAAAGLGAGALAAGAVIFGEDFMSESSFPEGFGGGGGLTFSVDPTL